MIPPRNKNTVLTPDLKAAGPKDVSFFVISPYKTRFRGYFFPLYSVFSNDAYRVLS
jgi:hypothetical protein